jgi:hypothetical protein
MAGLLRAFLDEYRQATERTSAHKSVVFSKNFSWAADPEPVKGVPFQNDSYEMRKRRS